jgi:quinoprotein glucose dehydrogenase
MHLFAIRSAGFVLCLIALSLVAPPCHAQDALTATPSSTASVAAAPDEAVQSIKKFKVPEGFKVDLWAAEPMLENPVAFSFDEKGRAFVCETFRLGDGVDDIRGIMDWLDEELASRTADERLAEMKRHLGERFSKYSKFSERIRMLEDRDGDGKADSSKVFAENFKNPLDGIAAGVLCHNGDVYYANIPDLWLLRDTSGDGVADSRKSLFHGFGVRVGFLGHDLHGLHFGPDGKLYFSIGDRGSNIQLPGGRSVGNPDSGCVFRCNPDGSDLEVFAFGLRNPQDLVFDQYGDLFTGDNNSDSGDEARWVYLVEGGDSGWRVGYQFMEQPYSRGPFNAEKLWYPQFPGQAAYIVPPIANIASGPSGVAFYPGTGMPASYSNHFFLVDFRGGAANSGIHDFTLTPRGASFELTNQEHFVWGVLPTDVKFGPGAGIYFTDWVEGWSKPGKGRIYRVHDPALDNDARALETKRLLAEGMDRRNTRELGNLLAHPDIRVRQEAQFALAARGLESIKTFSTIAQKRSSQLARLHAIWGLGQIARQSPIQCAPSLELLVTLLGDADSEVRAQAAKVLGDARYQPAFDGLIKLLEDSSARSRFFAAMNLGKLGSPKAIPPIEAMLRANADKDPLLRHAGVMAMTWIGDMDVLSSAARDAAPSVRMAALLAMRRLHRGEIAEFLGDSDPAIVLEAARAINDDPINGAMDDLAKLISRHTDSEPLLRRVINANLHAGNPANAQALARFAARNDAPEKMRVEAMATLAGWVHPSGRDRVVGLWRPIAGAHARGVAVEALQPALAEVLHTAPDRVVEAALEAASRLTLTNATAEIVRIVGDKKLSSAVRVAALDALAALDPVELETALESVQADSSESLRQAATRLLVMTHSPARGAWLTATLENGTTGEKQAALAALGALSGSEADPILGSWLDKLRVGEVAPELRLDLVEAAAKRSDPAVKKKLEAWNESRSKEDPLVEYQECLIGGNAAQGKTVFFERPEAQCVRCHKVGSQGGDVGPDLTHVGAQKERSYILESVLLPNKQIAQGFDSVMVVNKSGDIFAGVLKSEDAAQLVINTPESGLVTIKKADIQSRKKALSPMPEGIGALLSKQDLRNLVEFLASQK